jgi:hypothetical protein
MNGLSIARGWKKWRVAGDEWGEGAVERQRTDSDPRCVSGAKTISHGGTEPSEEREKMISQAGGLVEQHARIWRAKKNSGE